MSQKFYSMPFGIHEISFDSEIFSGVPSSLKEILINKLVSNCSLLPKDSYCLPPELKQPLLSAAVSMNEKESIKSVLKFWPRESLKFEIPRDLKTWKLFVMRKDYSSFEMQISELYSCMQLIAARYLEYASLDNVQCLDFTELPAPSKLMRSLCSQILYRNFQNCQTRDPNNKLTVKVNCIIDCNETADMLCSALVEMKKCGKHDCLSIEGLCVTGATHDEQIVNLLDLLDPEFFYTFTCNTVFGFRPRRYLSLGILRALRKFTHLRTLDLSHAYYDFELDEYAVGLSELLHELDHLKELNLGTCAIDGLLKYLFRMFDPINVPSSSNSYRQLEYLSFAWCYLTSEDITYLAQSPCVRNLKALDLRCNKIDVTILRELLTACNNLCILDLEFCNFFNGMQSHVFQIFSTMQKLRFLDVTNSNLNSNKLLSNVKHISEMSSLEYIKIDYTVPKRMYNVERKERFLSMLKNSIKNLRNPTLKPVDVIF